jgi:hypothetical protein
MQIGGDPPAGMVGDPYKTAFTAIDATLPCEWSVFGGTELPAGLALDRQSGTLSGTPEPEAEGPASFSVMLSDAGGAVVRRVSLLIKPALKISTSIPPPSQVQDGIAKLEATGGDPPYSWSVAGGSRLPDNLRLDPAGDIIGIPQTPGTTLFRVKASDQKSHTDAADFRVVVRGRGKRRQSVSHVAITVRPPSWLRQRLEALHLHQISNLLFALLGIVVPSLGTVWIIIYSFGTGGPHWTYLGTAMLASLAAFLSGCLAGFLFGVPRVVSSGEARQQKAATSPGASPRYTPSTNLAEVSDWLTKLLLGAGLVQLTHLGAPVAGLIDHVAAGLYTAPGDKGAAQVTAAAILIGLAFAGVLDGYIGTTMWYQKHIASQ